MRAEVVSIKAIRTYRFEIELFQLENLSYRIVCKQMDSEDASVSEPMRDLRLALDLFDIKVRELEGN